MILGLKAWKFMEGLAAMLTRQLIQLKWETVWISEEDKAPVRVFIGSYWLDDNSARFQFCLADVHVVDFKCEMAKTTRFGVGRAHGWIWKREELDLRSVGKSQVQLVGLAFGSIMLSHYLKAQALDVEALRDLVVRANDCRVVDTLKTHGLAANLS
jgi:hypothetical protein